MPKPEFAPLFLRGVDLFNKRKFWEAHEAWEELWLAAESDVVQFLQGLIQLAAAYHHVQRGTLRGAVRLFDAALGRLAPFPPGFCGVDRPDTEAAARRHRAWAAAQIENHSAAETLDDGAYPKLVVASTEEALKPPREPW
jgi:uncharacterized protein